MLLSTKAPRLTLGHGLREHQRLLSAFASSPGDTGAVAPSSRRLAELLTADVGLDVARTIVELGAGTGVVTREIQARAGQDSTVLVLELNPYLARPLAASFPKLQVVNDCAESLPALLRARGLPKAETIVSALPWASFAPDRQERLLDAVEESLSAGGQFCSVAYLHASGLPGGRRFHRELKRRFASVEATRVVWRNLPPAFVYRCR